MITPYEEFASKITKDVLEDELLEEEKKILEELKSIKVLREKKGIVSLLPEYVIGRVDIGRDGTGYLDIFDSSKRDLIVERRDLKGSIKGDIVVAKSTKRRRGRESAKIIHLLKREKSFTICFTEKIKREIVGLDIKTKAAIELKSSQKSLKNLPPKTILKVDSSSGEILEVLGVLDDALVDEKISLALFNKTEEFDKGAEEQALTYGDFVDKEMYSNRIDLTSLPFCTIDPVTAKDHDDAIYFDTKNHTLYVAIADVSEYVTPNSLLDKEARKRGFSIYLPHKSIPMLPRALSENICSLKEGEVRLAFVFKIKLHKRTLKPTSEELFEAIITPKRGYSYERIDRFLDGEEDIEHSIGEFLHPLFSLTSKLRKKRLESGYDFFSDDQVMLLDKNQELIEVKREKETPSHSLIEECMLLANTSSAKMIKDGGIFRIHQEPDDKKITILLDDLALIGIYPKKSKSLHGLIQAIQKEAENLGIREDVDRMIIRSQNQALYSAQNCGHFGLGFEAYTHFTSPIRRYSDLILHRLLKSIIKDSRERDFILKQIESVASEISTLEREVAKVEWDFKDRKYARWAEKNIGAVLKGVVVDSKSMPLVKIAEKIDGARVFIRGHNELERLHRVRVKIVDSDIATARIEGVLVEVLDHGIYS